MLHLQEITLSYMTHQFQPELLEVVLESCSVLQRFAVDQFEDDLINLLSVSEDMDSSDVRDQFLLRIRQAINDVLVEHLITIDQDSEPTLGELNEVASLLLTLQNLEDTNQVAYRVFGHGTGRVILLDLLNQHSTLAHHRAMEVISVVDDKLIQALQAMVDDKEKLISSNETQRACWLAFQRFTAGVNCLGARLYKEGYFGLTFEELRDLSRFNLQTYLSESALTRPAQGALDALSLMYICRDTYQSPLLSLDKHSADLFNDAGTTGRIRVGVNSLYVDFNSWQEAQKPGLATNQGVIA